MINYTDSFVFACPESDASCTGFDLQLHHHPEWISYEWNCNDGENSSALYPNLVTWTLTGTGPNGSASVSWHGTSFYYQINVGLKLGLLSFVFDANIVYATGFDVQLACNLEDCSNIVSQWTHLDSKSGAYRQNQGTYIFVLTVNDSTPPGDVFPHPNASSILTVTVTVPDVSQCCDCRSGSNTGGNPNPLPVAPPPVPISPPGVPPGVPPVNPPLPVTPPNPPGSIAANYAIGIDMLNTRTGFYIAVPESGIRIYKFTTAYTHYEGTFIDDSVSSANYPTLAQIDEGEGLLSFYRIGLGTLATPYRYIKRLSFDGARTWTTVLTADGKLAMLTDKKWARIVVLGDGKRARGEAVIYNDGSGKDSKGLADGTGLMQVNLYDAGGKFVGAFPIDGKGIAGKKADDAGFGVEYVNDANHDIRVCFFSGGSLVYAVSVEDGKSWLDITSQMK